MKKLLTGLIFLQSTTAYASVVTLDDILQSSKQKRVATELIMEEGLALESKNLADTQTDPFRVSQTLSNAISRGVLLSGYEHEVSLSKEFKFGNIQTLEQQQNRLNNEAHLIEQERHIINFDNHLKNLYHQHCLDGAYVGSFQEGYDKFSLLYEKKQKAYEHDEIAKTELLQLEFEKNRLQIVLDELNRKKKHSQKELLSLTTLERFDTLSCQDIYPITQKVDSLSNHFKISTNAYHKRIESTKIGLKRYSRKLETIEVSMGFSKELDTDFYRVGLSIPLNFSSRKSEYERASLMHQSSALTLQNEQYLADKKYQVQVLKSQLSRTFESIEAHQENMTHYSTNLLPLMKKSYDYGESSVVEYLLSQRKLTGLKQELLAKQKGYYTTLFQLYSMSETEEK